jgi:hypothetical protein
MPKVVFSTTLPAVKWNSRLVRGDVAEELARLRQGRSTSSSRGWCRCSTTTSAWMAARVRAGRADHGPIRQRTAGPAGWSRPMG